MAAEKDDLSRQPFVSICIPAYNQTEFLKKTLDSVAAQTYRHFEVVVTDDSQTDDVEQLVSGYTSRLKISYRRNPRQLGSPANWNAALDLAGGELVKILHHDDWFSGPASLETMVRPFLHNEELGFVFCASEVRHIGSGEVTFNRPDNAFLGEMSRDPRILFRFNMVGAPSATIFRRTPLRFDEKLQYLVDVDFYIRLLSSQPGFRFLTAPLVVNTADHPGQVTAASKTGRIQIGEHLHLYSKIYPGMIPGKALSNLFINLFRGYSLRTLDDVNKWGYSIPAPKWYFTILVWISRLKAAVRKRAE